MKIRLAAIGLRDRPASGWRPPFESPTDVHRMKNRLGPAIYGPSRCPPCKGPRSGPAVLKPGLASLYEGLAWARLGKARPGPVVCEPDPGPSYVMPAGGPLSES